MESFAYLYDMTNKPYRPQPGSASARIARIMADGVERTRRQIEAVYNPGNDNANTFWHGLQYMTKRGGLLCEVRLNPATNRMASFYKITA